MTATVIPMKKPTTPTPKTQQSTFALPDTWQQKTPVGFMGYDSTPAGRLVRLADVVRWLEEVRSLPRARAVDALCEAMPGDVMQWLYEVRPNDFATASPIDFKFGYATAADIAVAKKKAMQENLQRAWENEQSTWGGFRPGLAVNGGMITLTAQEPTEPGRPALLKRIRASWPKDKLNRAATVDMLDEPRSMLTRLAMPFDKAHAHWGWGALMPATPLHDVSKPDAEPKTLVELIRFRKEHPAAAWTLEQKRLLSKEFEMRNAAVGASGVAAAMAAALGISVSRFNGLKASKNEPGKRSKAA